MYVLFLQPLSPFSSSLRRCFVATPFRRFPLYGRSRRRRRILKVWYCCAVHYFIILLFMCALILIQPACLVLNGSNNWVSNVFCRDFTNFLSSIFGERLTVPTSLSAYILDIPNYYEGTDLSWAHINMYPNFQIRQPYLKSKSKLIERFVFVSCRFQFVGQALGIQYPTTLFRSSH